MNRPQTEKLIIWIFHQSPPPPPHSRQLCVQVRKSVQRSESLNVWLLPNVYTYIYKYTIYIGLSLWRLYFYTNPVLDMNKNPDMRTLYILKQGYRQKWSRCCLKWYLGVQLLLCICVFSDVSRSFCSTTPERKNCFDTPGVWCICLFMWKMFYVLFIPSGNDDDDSWLNDRTLINLSLNVNMEFLSFLIGLINCVYIYIYISLRTIWSQDTCANKPTGVTLHIYLISFLQHLSYVFILHITALIVKPERAGSSACVCKLSIWLTTNTVSGVQQLLSGEIWCRQRVNSSIQRLLGLVCPNAPMGKESPIH